MPMIYRDWFGIAAAKAGAEIQFYCQCRRDRVGREG